MHFSLPTSACEMGAVSIVLSYVCDISRLSGMGISFAMCGFDVFTCHDYLKHNALSAQAVVFGSGKHPPIPCWMCTLLIAGWHEWVDGCEPSSGGSFFAMCGGRTCRVGAVGLPLTHTLLGRAMGRFWYSKWHSCADTPVAIGALMFVVLRKVCCP